VMDNFCDLSLFCDFAFDFLLVAVEAIVDEDVDAVAIVSLELFLLHFLDVDWLESTTSDNFLFVIQLPSLMCSLMALSLLSRRRGLLLFPSDAMMFLSPIFDPATVILASLASSCDVR